MAFYPGACNEQRHPADWITGIPLLVLTGAADVWTPLAPCKIFLDGAIRRSSAIELVVYPDAFHGFDGDVTLDNTSRYGYVPGKPAGRGAL